MRSLLFLKNMLSLSCLGTEIVFTVFHEDAKLANLAINEALNEIEQVEKLMSIYRPDSQLNQLNREGILPSPSQCLSMFSRKRKSSQH